MVIRLTIPIYAAFSLERDVKGKLMWGLVLVLKMSSVQCEVHLDKQAFTARGDGATLTSAVLADLLPPTAGGWDFSAAFLPDTWCSLSMGRHWNCLRATCCSKDTCWLSCFNDNLYLASHVTCPVRRKSLFLAFVLQTFLLFNEERKYVLKNKYSLKKKEKERQIEKKKDVLSSFPQYYLSKLLHVRTSLHSYAGLFYSVTSVIVNALNYGT